MCLFRSVTDGYCSTEQADLIQLNLEKRLNKIYKIDEILGKSLSKSLVNYDDNEDEEDISDKNSSTIPNDETKPIETTKSSTSKIDSSLNNQISPSSAKSNLSPGEIKPVSPSSLSEASPISN